MCCDDESQSPSRRVVKTEHEDKDENDSEVKKEMAMSNRWWCKTMKETMFHS